MKAKGLLVSAAFALAIAMGVAALKGGFAAADAAAGFQAWSDAFFAAAVFVGGAGILAFAASDGLFDILRYGVGKVARLVLSREKRASYPRTFFDYRMMKRGRPLSGFSAGAVGLACLILAGVFLALYMNT